MHFFENIQITPYALPLIKPLFGKIRTRKGFVLQLKVDEKRVFADVAPLDGVSEETYEDVEKQLLELQDISPQEWYPSVQFAIETAKMQLELPTQWVNPLGVLPINALLYISDADFMEQALAYEKRGYETLKIKVGYKNIKEELKLLNQLKGLLKKQTRLRLDMGGRLGLNDSILYANALLKYNLEYIEDPVLDLSDLDTWFFETQMPYALDSIALKNQLSVYQNPPKGLVAFVVKPTLLGYIPQTSVPVVLSSCFESGLGLYQIALAQACILKQAPTYALGLSTYEWLEKDILNPPFRVFRGRYDLKKACDWLGPNG